MKKITISEQTAYASITALRQWNKNLDTVIEEYENKEGFYSCIESAKKFKVLVKHAFDELQKETGDRTPLETRGN